MMQGQRVEIESKGDIFRGAITKVINSNSCVVSWRYKKGRNEFKYNVLYLKNEVEKGRVHYEEKSFR